LSETSVAPVAQGRPRLLNLTLAATVFALAGPPIGGLAMLAFLSVSSPQPVTASMVATAVVFSYLLGGVQALVTGIGTALTAWSRGGTSLWHPVLTVLGGHLLVILGLLVAALVAGRPRDGTSGGAFMAFLAFLSPLLSLPTAVICWFLARPLLRAQ
jgi:hypothetical protein